MRSCLAFLLVTALAACSGSSGGTTDAPDANGTPDGGLIPPERGFQVVTPTLQIPAGAELTYCHYFRTPNTSAIAIQRWASRMTPGGHHLVTYLTSSEDPAPGTTTAQPCGFGASSSGFKSVWVYSAHEPDSEQAMPGDDGTGTPLGQLVQAGQVGFIQMHFVNPGDKQIEVHVELNAYAYPEGAAVTPVAPFITYNTNINLPPGSAAAPQTGIVSGSCAVETDAKFVLLSTLTFKQGVHTSIKDGTEVVFESTSWDHPGERAWSTPPFFSFASGKLTYACEYANPNNRTIITGTSPEKDEQCMAIGFFFPAPGGTGHFCLDSFRVY